MYTYALPFLIAAASPAFALTFFDPVTQTPPVLLSALGVYTDIGTKQVDPALKYFEVNAALWSDGSAKHRWLALPTGTPLVYNDNTDVFDYPERAMFVKNFYLDSVPGDTTSRRYWETRILVNKHDEGGFDTWYGFTYRWNKAQTEAYRVLDENGFDTVFYYHPNGASKPQTYKKWHFPSQAECFRCHKKGFGSSQSRGVLGFFPAQLKRAAPRQPSINQVTWLYNQGVFNALPSNIDYNARWKGISETIPSGPADLRFRVVDSMARSYIAANCSGCHSERNAGLAETHSVLIYDWHQFTPKIEFGTMSFGTAGIDNDVPLTPLPNLDDDGRPKYVVSVQRAGMAGNPFWTMNLPGPNVSYTIITPGFPAASVLLYRQFAKRRTAWRDSLTFYRKLTDTAAENPDPAHLKSWIFANPWGSAAWRADMASHGIKVDSLLIAQEFFFPDGHNQMPLLATYIPDTAAMRVLGEWAGNYRTLVRVEGQDSVVRLNGKTAWIRPEMPRLQNRMLIVPNGWSGQARMFSLSGRAYALHSAGRGQYAIPANAPTGVYLFRVGNRAFRASLLR